MNHKFFDISRTIKLFKRQLFLNKSNFLISYLGILAAYFIISVGIASKNPIPYQAEFVLFYIIYFILGYILTSRSFQELTDQRNGYQYLILPVSNFERLFVSWFISSVLYTIIIFISFIPVMIIANYIASFIGLYDFTWFPFKNFHFLNLVGIYLVTQTIFLTGSLFFRKNAFFKTILSIIIIYIANAMIVYFIFYIFNIRVTGEKFFIINDNFNLLENTYKIIFWYFLAPFMLIVSFFRLKEIEI